MNNIQDYSTYSVVSLDTVVAGAKMRLGIKNSTEDDMYLKDLAIEGVKKMRAAKSYVQAYAVLPIVNLRAELPSNFVMLNKFNGVALVDSEGDADFSNGAALPFNTGEPFYKNSPYTLAPLTRAGSFQIQNGYIYFGSTVSQSYVAIMYLAVNQNEDGDIIIPEVYQNYLIPYLCYQWCLTNNDNRFSSYQRSYETNLRAVRGTLNLPDASEQQLIAYKFNTII